MTKSPMIKKDIIKYQPKSGQPRELVRFNSGKKVEENRTELQDLENTKNKDDKYDQFRNKKSTYDFSMYTSTFDQSKVTND